MYLVNGIFLVILALALFDRLKAGSPAMCQAATVFGLIWAALVFASGFITLYGWEIIANLYRSDPAQAATLRLALDTVTIGLDHSDRFLGCLWVLLVSWAALRAGGTAQGLELPGPGDRYRGHHQHGLPGAYRIGDRLWAGNHRLVDLAGNCHAAQPPRLGGGKTAEVESSHTALTFAGK